MSAPYIRMLYDRLRNAKKIQALSSHIIQQIEGVLSKNIRAHSGGKGSHTQIFTEHTVEHGYNDRFMRHHTYVRYSVVPINSPLQLPDCFTLVAGLLAISHYLEGPTTDHLDTGFSLFPCV